VSADTGWTMWMVSHFHYDPVWWNTQAAFTEVWYDLPAAESIRPAEVKTAFDLCRAHLEAARLDPDYKFVLAEVDYLKPYWDSFPEDRADLRRFLSEGRVELVGGTYNEPNTNLTHPESTIRNAVYGVGYQRDVVGGDPASAWMLDVFGHDPAFPGLMADAGLTSSSWARGPFHMWGPNRHVGDNRRMQFASEFEWISPDGRGLLTSYMANHYGAGWEMERRDNVEDAIEEAARQFRLLRPVAATRNVLLPVGADHVVPSRWCTEVHREWAKRYVWPRFVVGLPRDFFGAVRHETGERRTRLSPQTRDMNPVYTGKDVSYIDTKQAQRVAEIAVLDGERLATLAMLLGGARYPSEALDKAWRQLAFGAHHDAITGSESDQVYLDLLGGWREAYELGDEVRTAAIDHIAAHTDTSGAGRPVMVVNTLSWPRDGITAVRIAFPEPGHGGVELRDDVGGPVAAMTESLRRHGDGTLAEITLTFLAKDVPALGHRVYRAVEAADVPGGWTATGGLVAANAAFGVEADPGRGGALSSIRDLRTGRELLRPGRVGGELVVFEEHATHPVWGEGPWHLLPKGPGRGTGENVANVRVEKCPIGRRVVSETTIDELRVTQETLLWDGVDRVDFRSHVDGSIGHDRLLRMRFAVDVPGARPVSETGFAAVGRSFGFPDADAAESLWTLDNPAHNWVALSSAARIALTGADGSRHEHAIGVAEVIEPDVAESAGARFPDEVRALVAGLAGQGVTATCSRPGGPRYGSLDVDSNLPDVRIVLGGPGDNAFAAAVLADADVSYATALDRHGRVFVPAVRPLEDVWTPTADLRGPRDLPVLIVAGDDLGAEITRLSTDVADSVIEVSRPSDLAGTPDPLDGYSVGLLNQGTPGFVAGTDGTLYLNLMRSCSTWPCGVWIDGARRTAPDGSSFAWQHWSHTFSYSLVAGPGDWRDAGFVRAGQEYNHGVLARPVRPGGGALSTAASLASVEPGHVVLTALKPKGNPLASGEPGEADVSEGVIVRVYESSGRPAEARIRLLGGLTDARVVNVLEETRPEGHEQVASGTETGDTVTVRLGASGIMTLSARPATSDAPGEPSGRASGESSSEASSRLVGRASGQGRLGPRTEPAQPVFARYWLHNKGPAPVGNLPVSVHIGPATTSLSEPEDSTTVRVTVSTSTRPAGGRVELAVPQGLSVDHAPLEYDLVAGEHAEFTLTVRAHATGTYFLAARIGDALGQVIEDSTTVIVGAGQAETPVSVALQPEGLLLPPGGEGEIIARLSNPTGGEVRGEAQLISPMGTWGPGSDTLVTPWTQGFAVAPGAAADLRFVIRASAAARRGAHWWVMAKVACFGRLHYTMAIPIQISADEPV
ncbi:glycoside hydrolase family 38 C-terminal domain-containing protein, partial [Actinomadura sp. HBU206391]|uniref:glycoside hydrolase family 38 N-terminal domain-containing protein n=1 Tax=Actinomadura sp. HBU206391 TaxID=2731692 RepID=UPI00165008BE